MGNLDRLDQTLIYKDFFASTGWPKVGPRLGQLGENEEFRGNSKIERGTAKAIEPLYTRLIGPRTTLFVSTA